MGECRRGLRKERLLDFIDGCGADGSRRGRTRTHVFSLQGATLAASEAVVPAWTQLRKLPASFSLRFSRMR